MDTESIVIAIVAVVVGLVFIRILGKAFLGMAKGKGEKLTKKDIAQQRINRLAHGTDEERYRALGKSAHKAAKKKSGCGCLILLIIIIIVLLLLFSEIELPSF